MNPEIKSEQGYQYVESGKGPILMLLHGLFGALSNFKAVFDAFSPDFRVVIPLLPIYEKSHTDASVDGLTAYLEEFVAIMGIQKASLLGNSLGGHIALVYALRNPEKVSTMILTGSSGLFESGMGTGFPKRGSYEYIRERVAYTFYSPETATKELVDEVFEIVGNNFKTLRILKIARSAQRHNMRNEVPQIHVPTLLIWGLNDNITPTHVGHEFEKLMPNAELHFIDHCGHAPMMEQSEHFNRIVSRFLRKHTDMII